MGDKMRDHIKKESFQLEFCSTILATPTDCSASGEIHESNIKNEWS
jgi:hypothetical protein